MRALWFIGFFMMTGFVFGQIRVSDPVHDLGDIFEQGGKVTSKFELQNPYRQDTIRILDITSSCGCTAVLVQDTLLLPLSSVIIAVTYDPAGRLGLFVKSVELTTKTGNSEVNKLFLKIAGNVVAENFKAQEKNQELINYQVAPLYFYPVTVYDTSYFDFNYIGDFINDLTYEIDFYQFTTLGMEVELQSFTDLEKMENILAFFREKMMREFQKRGFNETTVFLDEPIFQKATDLPKWASASIRLYSVNFDAGSETESVIELATDKTISKTKILLDYERFALPEVEEVMDQVNFESIEGKLFLNGELDLSGTILMPWKKSDKMKRKFASKLEKVIQKRIKETTGAGKKEVRLAFDSLGVHADDKYRFILWDEADQDEKEIIRYEEKSDNITRPFLPTYRQSYETVPLLGTNAEAFNHFWENCILNAKAGHKIEFIIESCITDENKQAFENIEQARIWGTFIQNKIWEKWGSGADTLIKITVKPRTHNPVYELLKSEEKAIDISSSNYFNIIPLVHNQKKMEIEPAKPYMVNFDYFFTGIDKGAWGFQRFVNYLVAAVRKAGFVELRIESSISKIPIERTSSNLRLAYKRLMESEKRIKQALAVRLVDPNRLIFTDEHILEQGPVYDGTKPIIKYRDFQYLRLIPEKTLK